MASFYGVINSTWKYSKQKYGNIPKYGNNP